MVGGGELEINNEQIDMKKIRQNASLPSFPQPLVVKSVPFIKKGMKRIHIWYIVSCLTFKIIDFYVTCIKTNVSRGIVISLVIDIRQFKHQTVSYNRLKDSCHRVIKFASVSDILISGFV